MTGRHYTLTAPGGHILARDTNRRVVEDRFARIIQEDGFPDGTTGYVMHERWDADGRQGFTGPMVRVVLGCDDTGWWELDGSKVPATASPARFLVSPGSLAEKAQNEREVLTGGKYPVLGLGSGS